MSLTARFFGDGRTQQLFASGPDDPRARRPVDWVRAVLFAVALVVLTVFAEIGSDFDRSLSEALLSFPRVFRVLWLSGFWLAFCWSCALLLLAIVRRRYRLVAESVAAVGLALAISSAVGLTSGDVGEVITRLFDVDGPPTFPPGAPASVTAVIAAIAPYVTLPWRRFGRVLVAAMLLGSLFLGVTQAFGAIASLVIGLLAGTIVHLVVGSPGGFPTVERVRDALDDLGVEVQDLAPTLMRRDGQAILTGADSLGPIEVRVYGRDAWEGELLADIWRLAWYRGTRRQARLSRSEYVEHEGFMTYHAERGGLRVPAVVTAGLADNGDALIVVRPDGTRLSEGPGTLDARQVADLWSTLDQLHRRGIVHQRIDLDRLAVHADGTLGFNDLSSASVHPDDVDRLADRAQLLGLTVVTAGTELAIEQASQVMDNDRLVALLPYVQEAVLPPLVRSALRDRKIDLDGVRHMLAEHAGAEDTDLVPLRRVTGKSLLNLGLLAIAAYTLIGMISGLDLGAFGRSLADANWWWLLAALGIGQLPRLANAVSTMGSTPATLPFGPTAALHFATCYVNLAVPSSAGRIAITTRFFQRFGVPPASALAAGVIDSVSELLTQVLLFLLVFFASDVDLEFTLDESQLSGLGTTAMLIIVVLVVAAIAAYAIPPLRRRVTAWYRDARAALAVLRNPRKVLQLFGGNISSQVLFAIALSACVHAFGFDVPLSSLILINTIVSLFAGLLPVPGGVGVSEAGISLGLTRAGIPAETAVAIALTYRFATFYLPPIWGVQGYRWMVRRRYL